MSTKNYKSEGKARVLLNLLPEPASIVDEKGHFLNVNDAFEEITGLSREELVGKSFLDVSILTAESKAVLLENLKNRVQGGTIEPYEVFFRDKAGETKCVELRERKVSYAGHPANIVVFHDIIRRKENERRLKEYSDRMEALVEENVKEIKDKEEKFRNLAEHSPNMIFINQKGKIVYANQEAEKTMGYKKGEFYSSEFNFLDLIAPESRELVVSNFAKHTRSEDIEPYDYGLMTKDGRRIDAIINTKIITYDGEPALLGIVADITERKKIEAYLKKEEQRFRDIVDNSGDWIWEVDPEGRYTYASPAIEKLLGYKPGEVLGKFFYDFFLPEDREQLKKAALKVFASKESFRSFVNRNTHKNGSVVFLEISGVPVFDTSGKLAGFRGADHDITERKQRDFELKSEKNKLESMTQSVGAGFVVISKDYHVLWANKFIKEYKGDVEGKFCYATLNDLDHVCPDCGVKKVFENGANSDSHEYTSVDIKGNPYWVELIATPIKDEDGNVISATEIAVDITEKKTLQSKLAEYSHKLEKLVEERTKQLEETQAQLVKSERLAAIGELAGMVGHDLRNPLTGIKNAAYYLKKKGATIPEAQAKEMFEIIDKSIDRSNKIISDLLDYAREMHLELQETSPRSFLSTVLQTLKIPDKIKIHDLTSDETKVRVDPDKIERVFLNLIKNAIDAMPKGGTLEIKSIQKDGNVEISFADTGVGIPEEVLKKIFAPLFTTKAQGMGFGLAICKRIVEAHRGEISVKTAVGKGTTFTITLPINPTLEIVGEKEWINLPESLLSMTTKTSGAR